MEAASIQIPRQSADTVFLEKILPRKCKKHKQFSCQYIHLKPSQSSPKLCFQCIDDRSIPLNEVISIQLLLEGTSTTTFNTYPTFADNSIMQKIKDLKHSEDQISTDLSSFFDSLQAAVSQAIEKAKSAAKDNLRSLSHSYQDVFTFLDEISQIQKFQELVKDSNQNEDELRQFIQAQYSAMNNYTEGIKNKLMEFEKIKQSFSLNDANNKLSSIVSLIEGITLFATIANNQQQQQQQPCQQQSNQQPSSSHSNYEYQKSLIEQCQKKYWEELEKEKEQELQIACEEGYPLRVFLEIAEYFRKKYQQEKVEACQCEYKAYIYDLKENGLVLNGLKKCKCNFQGMEKTSEYIGVLRRQAMLMGGVVKMKILEKYNQIEKAFHLRQKNLYQNKNTYEEWQALSEAQRQANLSYLKSELGILD